MTTHDIDQTGFEKHQKKRKHQQFGWMGNFQQTAFSYQNTTRGKKHTVHHNEKLDTLRPHIYTASISASYIARTICAYPVNE